MSTNKIDVNVYDNMLDYFKGLIDNDKYCVAFIERFYNTIIYGSYNNGFKEEVGRFEATQDNSLKLLYELLKIEFAESFKGGWNHSSCYGWNLLPSLSNYVLVEIDSRNDFDRKWIFEEIKELEKQNNETIKK